MSGLKIRSATTRSGIVHLNVTGYLDGHTFRELNTVFQQHIAAETYCFVVDMRSLDHISSAGAGVFVSTAGACQDKGGDIVLVRPQQEIIDVFEVLGVYEMFRVVDHRDEGTRYFTGEELQRNR